MDVVECFVSIVGVFESMSRVLKFSLNLDSYGNVFIVEVFQSV